MPLFASRPRRTTVISAFVALFCSTNAFAQSAAELSEASRNASRIQREQDERQRAELQQSLDNSRRPAQITLPAQPSPPARPGSGCVNVRALRIEAAPHLSDETRARIGQAYTARCLGIDDIQQLLSDIVADYIARGQVAARAYIREQDASTGTLTVLVVEGRLEGVVLDDGGKNSILLGWAFPGLEGKPLNLRDLEMGLEQVNRLPSNNATLALLPGGEAGGSIVSIKNTPGRRWRVTGSADNQGGESTGRKQASISLGLDNPFGLNDFLNLTYRRAIPTDYARAGSVSKSLAYVVPYGYNTFTFGINDSLYVSTLNTVGGQQLRSNGDSDSRFAQVERVVYRDQTSRATVGTTLTRKDANNFLAEQFLATSSRTLSVWDIDAGLQQQWLGGVLSLQLGFSRGLHKFGALDDAPGLPGNAPHAQFRKLRYGASYYLPLALKGIDLNLSSSLTGQRGIDVLYGSEQVLVGGIYSVRGFVDTTISGDTGFVVRNDLSTRIPFSVGARAALLRPYLGIDYGRVKRRGADTQAGYLSGGALGVSLSSGDLYFDVFNAWPLGMTQGLRRESSRLYLQLRATL